MVRHMWRDAKAGRVLLKQGSSATLLPYPPWWALLGCWLFISVSVASPTEQQQPSCIPGGGGSPFCSQHCALPLLSLYFARHGHVARSSGRQARVPAGDKVVLRNSK